MCGGRSPKPVPPRWRRSACAQEQGQGAGHVSASLTGFLVDSRQIVGVLGYVSTAGMRRFFVTAAQPRLESPDMKLIPAMVGQWHGLTTWLQLPSLLCRAFQEMQCSGVLSDLLFVMASSLRSLAGSRALTMSGGGSS